MDEHEIRADSEFMKTVEGIKLAEQQAEGVVAGAKEKADQILRRAKEEVLKEREKAGDEAVALKNSTLQKGRDEIEKDAQKLLKRAEGEAEKVRKQQLGSAAVSAMMKGFLASLSE